MLTLPKRAAGDQEGFSLVELLVALTVLLIGILGLFAGFASSQKLSLVSERHATMSHIAEQEIERLEGMSYSTLELSTAPTHSTDPKVPDYYVTNGTPPLLAYDRTGTATESLLVDPAGAVAHMHTQQQGTSAYNVYDFVTATSDPKCAPGCPAGTSYKRVTVAVTVASGLEPTPVWSSSIIADPAAESVSGCGNGNCGNPATYCPDRPAPTPSTCTSAW